MRAPFQILAIPFRKTAQAGLQFCLLHRVDEDRWQFVAGGGEDEETPREAAIREICEETGTEPRRIIALESMTYLPANVIAERHRKYWEKDTYVIPEYHFSFAYTADLKLSAEHDACEWLGYEEAMARLAWDSNKTALYELRCRLLEED